QRRLRTGFTLLVGNGRPFGGEAGRQLRGQTLDFVHGLARGQAWRGLALDLHRRHAVVALQARRTVVPVRTAEGAERHHLARAVFHRPQVEILRGHAERRTGLDVDALDAATVDEIVDVRS